MDHKEMIKLFAEYGITLVEFKWYAITSLKWENACNVSDNGDNTFRVYFHDYQWFIGNYELNEKGINDFKRDLPMIRKAVEVPIEIYGMKQPSFVKCEKCGRWLSYQESQQSGFAGRVCEKCPYDTIEDWELED